MKKTLAAICLLAGAAAAPAFAGTIIDFEASGTPGSVNGLDYAIDGYVFNPTMDNIDISPSSPWGWQAPAHSGSFAALNNYWGVGELSRQDGGTFTFDSLWIKSWYGGDMSGNILGLVDGQVVASMAINSSGQWSQVVGNFSNIDKLRIDFNNGVFLIDDISLDNGAPRDLPEPASIALLGMGIAGMRLVARRRKG